MSAMVVFSRSGMGLRHLVAVVRRLVPRPRPLSTLRGQCTGPTAQITESFPTSERP
jgi:hypothetical protein